MTHISQLDAQIAKLERNLSRFYVRGDAEHAIVWASAELADAREERENLRIGMNVQIRERYV